jgi:hypothetical protein
MLMPTLDEIARAKKLVRWRADPEKIRVSIRKLGTSYEATITSLITHEALSCMSYDPEGAVMNALEEAELENFDGIDLRMEWAYDHPWR